MKKIGMVFLFVLGFLFSQFDWQDNGVAVRQGVHIEWMRTADIGDDDTVIFAWSDTRQGVRDIYAQKVDENGDKLWGENGITVVETQGRQEDPILVTDGNGGAYIIWRDYNDDPYPNGDIYAQHILSDGSLGWEETQGIPLSTTIGVQDALNMCSDGQSGAYVIWKDYSQNSFGSIYGTHLSNSGVLYPTTGIPILNNESRHNSVSIERAGLGHAILVWPDESIIADDNIRAQRINQNCETLWSSSDEEGVFVSSAPLDQKYPKVTYYDENHSIVVWEDQRNNSPDIYYQFLDVDGNTLLANDGNPLCVDDATQIKPRVKASDQGAYVIWQDYRNSENETDIYSQKVDHTGVIHWDSNGIPIVSAIKDQNNERLTVDDNGGVYYVWMDKRDNVYDIYLQHINSEGNMSFENNGLVISNAEGIQKDPVVRPSSQGAFVIFGEACSSYTCVGVHLQHVIPETGITLELQGKEIFSGIDGNSDDLKSVYLGNNESLIYWQDRRLSPDNQTYGLKYHNLNSLTENQDGVSLSDNLFQEDASIVLVGENLFMGFDQTDGDINQFYDLLDNNLNSILNASTGVDPDDGTGNNPYSQPEYSIVFNESENLIYYIYSDNRDGGVYNIYAQQFDLLGNLTWESSIKVAETISGGFFPSDDNVISAFPSNNGGCIILYDSGNFMGSSIYAIAIDSNGDIQEGWDSGGVKLSSYDSNQYIESFVKTLYGILVVFRDTQSGANDLYAQLISYSGELLFDQDGLNIIDAQNDQESSSVAYSEIANEVLICWDDNRLGQSLDSDLYCKYINFNIENDNLIYTLSEEIELAGQSNTPSGNQQNSFILSSQSGSFLIAWEDSRDDIDPNIYFQELSAYNFKLTNGGELLCDAPWAQWNPTIDIYSESEGSYIIHWLDLRSTGKAFLFNIYAQSYTTDWLDLDNNPHELPNTFGIDVTYPNPFNPSLSIDFTIEEISDIKLSIYNLYGQEIKVLYQGDIGAGNHTVKWAPDSDSSSGMYFARLENKSNSLIDSKKIIFIK